MLTLGVNDDDSETLLRQAAGLSVDRFYQSGQIRSRSLNCAASNQWTFSFVPSHLFAC